MGDLKEVWRSEELLGLVRQEVRQSRPCLLRSRLAALLDAMSPAHGVAVMPDMYPGLRILVHAGRLSGAELPPEANPLVPLKVVELSLTGECVRLAPDRENGVPAYEGSGLWNTTKPDDSFWTVVKELKFKNAIVDYLPARRRGK